MKLRCAGNVGFRRETPGGLWAFVLAACLTVSGCGGGAAPETVAGSKSNPETPAVPPATLLAGAYTGTLDGKSFVSFVTNSASPQINWYALYYFYETILTDVNPIIYSGSAELQKSGAAKVAEVREFRFNNPVRTGSASVTGASLQSHQLSVSGLDLPGIPEKKQLYELAALGTPSADVIGKWVGHFSDSSAGPGPVRSDLEFSNNLDADVTIHDCRRKIQLTSLFAADNRYFSVAVNIPNNGDATLCERRKGLASSAVVSLSGVAFVYPSPLAGKTRRLELVVVDSTGSGFSFRGDQ